MRKSKRRLSRIAFALCSLGMGASLGVHAQTTPATRVAQRVGPASIDQRWKESFDAFSAADQQKTPGEGGVVFVGSSSIRMWSDLEAQFSEAKIVKRGFGGSRMSDCAEYAAQLVLPYKPRLVVVYAGDNDLAEGQTPQQVLESFTSFVDQVHAALPNTRIAYLSIKPSPSRAALMAQTMETNALIAKYSATTPNLDFIDIYSKMLDPQGRPRADLFLADALHLNPAGYAVWKTAISPHLLVPLSGLTPAPAGLPRAP